MAANWIGGAIAHPGALRASAKRLGVIKGDQPLTNAKLEELHAHANRTGDTTLMHRVQLAHTLKSLRAKGHKD